MVKSSAFDFSGRVNNLVEGLNSFPDDEDLKGAVKALIRLQDTYQLQTSDMAAGNILNISHGHLVIH